MSQDLKNSIIQESANAASNVVANQLSSLTPNNETFKSSYIYRRPGQVGFESFAGNQSHQAPVENVIAQTAPIVTRPTVSTHETTSNYVAPSYHTSHYSSVGRSEIEEELIRSKQPIQNLGSNELVTIGSYRGRLLNKNELDNWRGPVALDRFEFQNDPNPEVIKKRLDKVNYVQELGVKYLNPGPAPRPGDLIIRERGTSNISAPPVVLREEGSRPSTPPPIVYREAPPAPPARIPEQVVEVEGSSSIAPRRVVVERVNNLPARPQSIIVEKWLPYEQPRRRVIHQRASHTRANVGRNLIIEWEAPEVVVTRQCRDLGVENADPVEYVRRYGSELKQSHELPACDYRSHHEVRNEVVHAPVVEVKPAPLPQYHYQPRQETVVQTTGCPIHYGNNYRNVSSYSTNSNRVALEGDVDALRLIDLDRHGLGEYRSVVNSYTRTTF